MGRIRTKDIKVAAKELIKRYPEKFTKNFEENKKALNELKIIDEKKMRNKIAGYIVRLLSQKS